MRRQMLTIILGDRCQHVWKRYLRFTYLTKKLLLSYIYIIYLKVGFVFYRIKQYFLSHKMLIPSAIASSCSNYCSLYIR